MFLLPPDHCQFWDALLESNISYDSLGSSSSIDLVRNLITPSKNETGRTTFCYSLPSISNISTFISIPLHAALTRRRPIAGPYSPKAINPPKVACTQVQGLPKSSFYEVHWRKTLIPGSGDIFEEKVVRGVCPQAPALAIRPG